MSAALAAVSKRVGYFDVSIKSFVAGCNLECFERLVHRWSFSDPSGLNVMSMEIGEHWKGPPRMLSTSALENGPSILPSSTSSLK